MLYVGYGGRLSERIEANTQKDDFEANIGGPNPTCVTEMRLITYVGIAADAPNSLSRAMGAIGSKVGLSPTRVHGLNSEPGLLRHRGASSKLPGMLEALSDAGRATRVRSVKDTLGASLCLRFGYLVLW